MTFPTLPQTPSMIFPVKRSPEVQGIDLQAWSGRRAWLPSWPWPIYHYDIGFSALHADNVGARALEFQTLLGFWNVVMTTPGRYFQFNDPDDNAVTDQGIGIGDGVQTVFQLVRALGGFIEPVRVPTITNVKVNGSPTSAYTLSAGGVITFFSAPPSTQPVTWTGTYNWLCQFDQTTVDFSNFSYQLYALDSLTFQTANP